MITYFLGRIGKYIYKNATMENWINEKIKLTRLFSKLDLCSQMFNDVLLSYNEFYNKYFAIGTGGSSFKEETTIDNLNGTNDYISIYHKDNIISALYFHTYNQQIVGDMRCIMSKEFATDGGCCTFNVYKLSDKVDCTIAIEEDMFEKGLVTIRLSIYYC